MALIEENKSIELSIPSTEDIDNVTWYIIIVRIGDNFWNVRHRYSEFVDLHQQLILSHGISKDLLPPKKLLGNKDPEFIEKRRCDLEVYLQTIASFTIAAMPEELAEFLEFKHYEIIFILQELARKCLKINESNENTFNDNLNPLQLMAIGRQLKKPHPSYVSIAGDTDFTHIAEYCSSLATLCVKGSLDRLRSSNIVMNTLPFSLNMFKNASDLKFLKCNLSKVQSLGSCRRTVKQLSAKDCYLKSISELLLCDSLHHGSVMEGDVECYKWPQVQSLDASWNEIEEIDKSIALLPNVQKLNLNSNEISSMNYLTKLPKLVQLDLSHNKFSQLQDLNTKLGNIVELNLSNNNLSSLEAFSKLYSLVVLELTANKIGEVACVKSIAMLPCLELLSLTGNPVAFAIDYRTRVLELFDKRACEICLDNEKPSAKELDKVAVLQALRYGKEGKIPTINIGFMPQSSNSLTMAKSDRTSAVKESK